MRYSIILFLTVPENKIAAMPENIGVVAILTVVLNYSILFPSFTFFLDGLQLIQDHLAGKILSQIFFKIPDCSIFSARST